MSCDHGISIGNCFQCWRDSIYSGLAELQRYREREPLVQELLAMVDDMDETTGDNSGYVVDAAQALRDFKIGGE